MNANSVCKPTVRLDYLLFEEMIGTGTVLDIEGSRYQVEIIDDRQYVVLRTVPDGCGSSAISTTSKYSYAYTHGGRIYRAAVDAAREIADALGY